MKSFKIQWNQLTDKDTFCCNASLQCFELTHLVKTSSPWDERLNDNRFCNGLFQIVTSDPHHWGSPLMHITSGTGKTSNWWNPIYSTWGWGTTFLSIGPYSFQYRSIKHAFSPYLFQTYYYKMWPKCELITQLFFLVKTICWISNDTNSSNFNVSHPGSPNHIH